MPNEVNIKVTVDGSSGEVSLERIITGFGNLLDAAENTKNGLLDKFSNIGNIFTGINQGIELVKKGFDAISEPIEAFANRTKLLAGVEAVLKSTGRDAEYTTEEIVKMASKLQETNKYTIKAKDIIDVQSIVLGFDNISKKAIPEVNQTIINLAAFMKTDLRNAAMTVGMALEAPEQAMRRLRQAGIVLDEAQQKNIKTMVAHGNTAGAQAALLGALKKRVDGYAVSQTTPLEESIAKLLSYWNKFVLAAGEAMTPFIESVVTGFTNYILPAIQSALEWFKQLTTIIAPLAKTIGETLFNSIVNTVKTLWEFKDVILGITTFIGFLTIALNLDTIALKAMYAWDAIVAAGKVALTLVTNGLTLAQTALNVAMNMTPIGWILTAVGLLVSVLAVIITRTIGWGKAWEYLKAAISIAGDYIKAFWNFAEQFSQGMIELLTSPYLAMYKTAVDVFSRIGSIMKKLVTGDFEGVMNEIKQGFANSFIEVINNASNKIKNSFNSFQGLGQNASAKWREAGKDITNSDADTKTPKETPEKPGVDRNRSGGGGNWKENKSAVDALDAKKKQEEADAKRTIDDELTREQAILDIDRKYDLLKIKYEKETVAERKAAADKVNADYNNKQADLDNKKKAKQTQLAKEELEAVWEDNQKKLKYNDATEVQILEQKKAYLAKVLALYREGTKEYIQAQKELNDNDYDLKIAKKQQKKTQDDNHINIQNSADRAALDVPGKEEQLKKFDANTQYDDEIRELKEKLKKGEITQNDFNLASETAEVTHQKKLNDIKKEYYDSWLGALVGLSKQEIEIVSQIVDNVGNAFGKIGDIIAQNASSEAESAKKSKNETMESDRAKALSYARTQTQKDKINREYDAKEKKMEEDEDKKARDKAKDWYAVQKAASEANAVISTYEGANKALAQGGFWGIAMAASVIIAGLANVASIAAQPLPKFAKGIIGIDGAGTDTSDSIFAMLSRNESVINAESSKNAIPLLSLINGSASFARNINDLVMNGGFALPHFASGFTGLGSSSFMNSNSKTYVNDNGELISEMRSMNNNLKNYAEAGVNLKLNIGKGDATKIARMGMAGMKKDKLL